MKVEFTDLFIERFIQRISSKEKIRQQFYKRVRLFEKNPNHPFLRDHPLQGSLTGLRAFSVTGEIRVVYFVFERTAYFVDIGTHNQVY